MDVEGAHSSAIFVFLLAGFTLLVVLKSERAEPNLRHVPTSGTSNYLLSYLDAFRFIRLCPEHFRRGYEKHRTTVFKVATWNRWLVLATGPRTIEQLRKASDDQVSLIDAASEPDAPLYHGGHLQAARPQSISGHAHHISQNLAFLVPSMKEEIASTLDSVIRTPVSEGSTGWQELDAMFVVANVTSRVVNRVVLGSPLTHDEEYAKRSVEQVRDVYKYKSIIVCTLLPRAIAALVRALSGVNQRRRRLRSMIVTSQRRAKEGSQLPLLQENVERPNDLLSWAFANASNQKSLEVAASHVLNLSTTATQTITMTFAHALYHLAANPELAVPMRKEIEQMVSREGWNKHSLDRMLKVDSFVKESMRMSNISSVSMIRKVLSPFTLSDGMEIPKGTLIAAAAQARHLDGAIYASPDTFDGFRFSKLHERQYGDDGAPGSSGMPFQLVTTTAEYLAWGYGRHACPGRFFAAVVVKMMLAYVVLHYDARFEDGQRPKDVIIGTNCLPNPKANILFKRR